MAYQFTQTGAEIQDILDQVGTNTGDISTINTTLTQLFTSTDVNINITIGGNGYASLASYAPTVPSGYSLFLVVCMGVSSITSKDAFTVEADGGYVYGTPNATISGLLLRYIFVRSSVI